jgi:hypothetical protein
LPKRGKIKSKTVKLPPFEGVTLTFTHINSADSGSSNLIIAGSTGRIYLPHFEKESQPLLEKISISTYPTALGLPDSQIFLLIYDYGKCQVCETPIEEKGARQECH